MKYSSVIIAILFLSRTVTADDSTFNEDYLVASDEIVYARVIQATEESFDFERQLHQCGINYLAQVLEVFKGELNSTVLEFASVFPLVVGEEYLIFGGRPYGEGELTVEWPADYEAAFADCEERLHQRVIYQEDLFWVSSSIYQLLGKWAVIGDDVAFAHTTTVRRACPNDYGQCTFVPWEAMTEELYQR